MHPLSTSVAFSSLVPPIHADSADTAAGEVEASAGGALPASVGQTHTGIGALSGRQIAVGPGEQRGRAQGAMAAISQLLSGLANALRALVMGPVMLARNLGAYVMRSAAPAPAITPFDLQAHGEVIGRFNEDVLRLHGELLNDPVRSKAGPVPTPPPDGSLPEGTANRSEKEPPPLGLHVRAFNDWRRNPGVVIAEKTYGGDAPPDTLKDAGGKLIELCGGNAATAEWISRFANQQMGAPLIQMFAQLPLGRDGSPFPLSGGQLRHEISKQEDGSVQVEMLYDWSPAKMPNMYLEPDASFKVDPQSRVTARCTLRFEPPADPTTLEMPKASLSKPLALLAEIGWPAH